MKDIISGVELQNIIQNGVNMICDAVRTTLGPKGNNVIIDTDTISPFITNDGATIARSISSSYKKLNAIIELVKEASLKTDEEVGDGTTTTLVLLQSLITSCFKEINNGISPIALKNELNESLSNAINLIKTLKIKTKKEDFISIASTSANDLNMGRFISEVFFKVKSRYAIKLEENNSSKTYYEIKRGYSLQIDDISSLYFKDKAEIILNNVKILILRGYLNNLELISEIINEAFERNKNVLIFASDYSEEVKSQAILYNLENKKEIYLLKTPDYASHKEAIEEDIAFLSNASIKNLDYENVDYNDIGNIDTVILTKNEVSLITNNSKIKKRVANLKKELLKTKSDYEKEFLELRIASLTSGIATIYIGGNTKTEIREKKMRFEDALCALNASQDGVLIGEGITYLMVGELLSNNTLGNRILKSSFLAPTKQILENAGLDSKIIIDKIKRANYKLLYDFETNSLESTDKTKILDPLNVSISSLKNAVSIASMLISTNYLVINENVKLKDIEI